MKKPLFLLSSLMCLSCFSAYATMLESNNYKTLEEKIVFTSNNPNLKTPPSISLMMGHKDGSKTRDFSLPKDSAYSEMRNLTRQHITGDGRVGGFFVDELISKDGQYVLILSGQVHETESNGKKTYSKQGTWMDSLGHTGTWVDEVQQQSPATPLAACGGK